MSYYTTGDPSALQRPQNSLPLYAREFSVSQRGLPPFSFCSTHDLPFFVPPKPKPSESEDTLMKYEECNPRPGSTKPKWPPYCSMPFSKNRALDMGRGLHVQIVGGWLVGFLASRRSSSPPRSPIHPIHHRRCQPSSAYRIVGVISRSRPLSPIVPGEF
ncbi:hypothetical protein LZ30DRAFT_77596 [Colletotrichum cereale]|nr:hypothetical protein LZ30DRAFT_77596 [Colletotrichum cereale]